MPARKAPPDGFCNASQANEILGNKMLYRYVERGLIQQYGPPTKKQKYYKISELLAVRNAENAFFDPSAVEQNNINEELLPNKMLPWSQFLKRHGLIDALNIEQQAAFLRDHVSDPKIRQCEVADCPCHELLPPNAD